MIGRVGLLQKDEMFRFTDAWDYYTLSEPERERAPGLLDDIAPRRYQQVEIRCLGVWDTVGALGIPGTRLCTSTYAFHETSLGGHVRNAFQALAIDERRGNFQPAVWVKQNADPDQVLEQVWFPGVHSNIGGGYVEHGLSDTTLLWMLSRLQVHDLVDFDATCVDGAIDRYHAEIFAAGKLQNSRSFFWKAIACPIPRAVGITDESERIHQGTIDRMEVAGPGDPYADLRRQAWLRALRPAKIQAMSGFERQHAFSGTEPGSITQPIVRAGRGLCDRLMRWLLGEA
jgi:hypothetical protein